jgi:hypothetical protein
MLTFQLERGGVTQNNRTAVKAVEDEDKMVGLQAKKHQICYGGTDRIILDIKVHRHFLLPLVFLLYGRREVKLCEVNCSLVLKYIRQLRSVILHYHPPKLLF